MTAEESELLKRIDVAFAGVTRGGGTSLHEAEELDNHGSAAELATAKALDVDTDWHDVRDEWIEAMPCAAAFLDAEGLRYYLPALMSWGIRRGPHSDCAADDTLTSTLGHRCAELMPLLTAEQHAVVRAFLRHQFGRYFVTGERERTTLARWESRLR